MKHCQVNSKNGFELADILFEFVTPGGLGLLAPHFFHIGRFMRFTKGAGIKIKVGR
jgi:hypothetical protein